MSRSNNPGGRPKGSGKVSPVLRDKIVALCQSKSQGQVAREIGISQATVWKIVDEHKKSTQKSSTAC